MLSRSNRWLTEYQREFGWKAPPSSSRYIVTQQDQLQDRILEPTTHTTSTLIDQPRSTVRFDTTADANGKHISTQVTSTSGDENGKSTEIRRTDAVESPDGHREETTRAERIIQDANGATVTEQQVSTETTQQERREDQLRGDVKAPSDAERARRREKDQQQLERDRQTLQRHRTPAILSYGARNTTPASSQDYMKTYNVRVPPSEIMPYTEARIDRMKHYDAMRNEKILRKANEKKATDALHQYELARSLVERLANRFETEYRTNYVDYNKALKKGAEIIQKVAPAGLSTSNPYESRDVVDMIANGSGRRTPRTNPIPSTANVTKPVGKPPFLVHADGTQTSLVEPPTTAVRNTTTFVEPPATIPTREYMADGNIRRTLRSDPIPSTANVTKPVGKPPALVHADGTQTSLGETQNIEVGNTSTLVEPVRDFRTQSNTIEAWGPTTQPPTATSRVLRSPISPPISYSTIIPLLPPAGVTDPVANAYREKRHYPYHLDELQIQLLEMERDLHRRRGTDVIREQDDSVADEDWNGRVVSHAVEPPTTWRMADDLLKRSREKAERARAVVGVGSRL